VLMMTARSQTLHRTRRRRADSGTLVVAAELHLAELPKSAIDVCYTSGGCSRWFALVYADPSD